MFSKHRREIYFFYDSDKLNELYIDYLKEMEETIPLVTFTNWDEVMERLFDDQYMHDTFQKIIHDLESQILHVISSVVKECERFPETDT